MTREEKGMLKDSVLTIIHTNSIPAPLNFKPLLKKGIPFQITKTFRSRPSEDNINLTENVQKNPAISVLFHLEHFYYLWKKNKLRKFQSLILIKFWLCHCKLGRGFVHGKSIFLIIINSKKELHMFGNAFNITLMEFCQNRYIIKLCLWPFLIPCIPCISIFARRSFVLGYRCLRLHRFFIWVAKTRNILRG